MSQQEAPNTLEGVEQRDHSPQIHPQAWSPNCSKTHRSSHDDSPPSLDQLGYGFQSDVHEDQKEALPNLLR